MAMPTMTTVDSSNILAIGYDDVTRELYVQFLNGCTYIYSDVPPETYGEMLQADSKGSFLNREVKPNYAYRQA